MEARTRAADLMPQTGGGTETTLYLHTATQIHIYYKTVYKLHCCLNARNTCNVTLNVELCLGYVA